MGWFSITQPTFVPSHIFIMQSKRWCFTLNNPSDEDELRICSLIDNETVKYVCFGRERGESGTFHFQGFVIFTRNHRLRAVKQFIGDRAHLEPARGSSEQARDYCFKDGDYEEFGEFPSRQGKRTDLDDAIEWADAFMAEHKRPVSLADVASEFPKIAIKYPRFVEVLRARFQPEALMDLSAVELNEWQNDLEDLLNGTPDDRTIMFYVDSAGGKGKTWFCRYYISKYPERCMILGACKRDDMAYMVDETKTHFFVNVPRGGMEFLQYTVLEQLKDQLLVSAKYQSQLKRLPKCHVIVMCNEEPDVTKMSEDRFNIKYI